MASKDNEAIIFPSSWWVELGLDAYISLVVQFESPNDAAKLIQSQHVSYV